MNPRIKKNKDIRRWAEDTVSFARQIILSVSATQDNWLEEDRKRCTSYITEMETLYGQASGRKELDQPLVNPRTYEMPVFPKIEGITNRDIRDFVEAMEDIFHEVIESQSIERARGVHASDALRYTANSSELKKSYLKL